MLAYSSNSLIMFSWLTQSNALVRSQKTPPIWCRRFGQWSCQYDFMFQFYRSNNFLIIKWTKCTNFSNSFLEWNPTCFRQFLCPSSEVFHCTHSSGICHTGYADSLRAGSGWNCRSIPILLCVQGKTPDDGQGNCLKHVEFYSKNKF
jgi:hypothetical protein